MHVKFIARGTGSAKAAADYLLGERDAAGHLRDGVEIRRGNPHVVATVADSLAFKHKYTSGVIAWAPGDRPTDAQIEAVLDKFEKTAWAGLAPDRYAWSAVEHRERGGGMHVHIFAARCDLETGRSLNIAPPGWQKTFGPLRDAFNHEHGWSWAGTRWLWTTIEQRIETLAILRVDIEQARLTLARPKQLTWRVELREIDGARFVQESLVSPCLSRTSASRPALVEAVPVGVLSAAAAAAMGAPSRVVRLTEKVMHKQAVHHPEALLDLYRRLLEVLSAAPPVEVAAAASGRRWMFRLELARGRSLQLIVEVPHDGGAPLVVSTHKRRKDG